MRGLVSCSRFGTIMLALFYVFLFCIMSNLYEKVPIESFALWHVVLLSSLLMSE